jgi:hypothetical protein
MMQGHQHWRRTASRGWATLRGEFGTGFDKVPAHPNSPCRLGMILALASLPRCWWQFWYTWSHGNRCFARHARVTALFIVNRVVCTYASQMPCRHLLVHAPKPQDRRGPFGGSAYYTSRSGRCRLWGAGPSGAAADGGRPHSSWCRCVADRWQA